MADPREWDGTGMPILCCQPTGSGWVFAASLVLDKYVQKVSGSFRSVRHPCDEEGELAGSHPLRLPFAVKLT